MKNKIYEGIDQQPGGAMTPTANVIRDAWVFGIIPTDETCAGWSSQRIEQLYEQVSVAWKPYGHLPSRLPPDLRERHEQIYSAAIARARDAGWNPALGEND
ncbi:hypothetical protein CKO25_13210 [Thiocapsa imhoffii]|uniref:Uncharacterized protein n=1 Tax=Thiocapsa imhoffii TaxID=382777 RepID=A0A9X0WJD9_9GAMM|nr:hypothetical protein [Thiocapsa imhoffii]MBK1645585.1 hypothetical protein [Thiocapsa imhoffii]